MRRRNVLTGLTAAAGWLLAPSSFAEPEQMQEHGTAPRETVTGIGGFFFRAENPKALEQWYREHLGIAVTPKQESDPVWTQQAGQTLFSPFPEATKYFGDTTKTWMINFRVRDLQKLAAQLEAAGISVKVDPTTYPNGRFARLHDPEGNPIELWQPMSAGARS